MRAKCPECEYQFTIFPSHIYSSTSAISEDQKTDIKEIDCPNCKAHIIHYAVYDLTNIVCRVEKAEYTKEIEINV